ncbi:MAG: AAA family ATPase [Candidatus Aminicenantes bacterium]|nr:AAA family ATPase [Candidatus Aminicenantes bacterium]
MLVITSGLPGTGKTSAAKELSEHLKADRLTTDELRSRIDKQPDFSQKDKARDLCQQYLRLALDFSEKNLRRKRNGKEL